MLPRSPILCLVPLAVSAQDKSLVERHWQPPFVRNRALTPIDLPTSWWSTLPTIVGSSPTVTTTLAPDSSLSQTSEVTTTEGLQPSAAVAVAASTQPPTAACWASADCKKVLDNFSTCYDHSGVMIHPNGDDGRSETYQRCLCIDQASTYKNILTNAATAPNDHVQQCFLCLHQAGTDIDNPRLTTMKLKWKIHDFCNTQSPNLYDLLISFLAWLKATNEPGGVTRLAGISAISTFADQWSSTSGMNVPTKTPPLVSRPSQTDVETTLENAIPTEYLQQLPSNWPYTAYGIARKAGATMSFPLTNPDNVEETVAWIYHEIRWNPRPLYTPSARRNMAIYQPSLEGWTPFLLNVSTSTQKATSAVVAAASSSTEVVQLSTTTTIPTPEPSSTSNTQTSDGPIRPTRSQDPVLPKAPDATDKLVENLARGTVTMVATPTSYGAATGVSSLNAIWEEVRSVMASLDSV